MTKNQATPLTEMERAAKARRTFWLVAPTAAVVILAALLYGAPKYLSWAAVEAARSSVEVQRIKGGCKS